MEILVISRQEIDEFVDYVLKFYGENDSLYGKDFFPPNGVSRGRVEKAVMHYLNNLSEDCEWGNGDSLDRERVREIMLNNKNWAHPPL